MSLATDIIGELIAAGLVLERGQGDRLRVDSPLGRPLGGELKEQILAHRDELLRWLDWCEQADELLLASTRRISARYPCGCPLDDAGWRAAEQALHAAHHSQDPEVFREALERYERFALDYFASYEKETSR